ncbi:MAG: MFS transporter [bacterium]
MNERTGPSSNIERKLARRQAWMLVFSSAASAWSFGFLSVVLPIYLKRSGYDPLNIGAFYTISGLLCALLLLFLGPLLDRRRKKAFLVLGTALPVLSFLLLSLSVESWAVTCAFLLGGIGIIGGLGGALSGATFYPLLFEKTGVAESTHFFSWNTLGWLLMAMLGSLCGGLPEWLAGWGWDPFFAYRLSFVLCALFAALAACLILPLREEHTLTPGRVNLFEMLHAARGLIGRFALTQVFVGLGAGFVVQLLSLWFFLKFGVSEVQISPWFAAANLAGMVAVGLVPLLALRRSKTSMVIFTQGLSAVMVLLMTFAATYQWASLLYLLRSALMNMSWPLQNAFLFSLVPPERRSSAISLANAAFGLCSSLAPLLGGAMMQNGWLDLPLYLGAISFFLAATTFFLFFRRRSPPS